MGDLIAKSPSSLSLLAPALSKVLERVGEGSLDVSVTLTDSRIVQELQARITALEAEIERERSLRIRAETLYGHQTVLNLQLVDLCKEHDVPIPGYYRDRH